MKYLQGPIDEFKNKDKAIKAIINALKDGSLAIFIGAGIGISATENRGFPNWSDLVIDCCEKMSIPFDKQKAGLTSDCKLSNNQYLLKKMNAVRSKCSSNEYFLDLVKNCLYRNVKSYDRKLLNTDLMTAIGSLLMNSIRGSANYVVNYNFDDLFEWYLNYWGFSTQIISTYPILFKRADVKILHPHGFLPLLKIHKDYKSDSIIFTQKDYDKVQNDTNDPWYSLQLNILASNLCLFIGLSGDDSSIRNICRKVYEEYYDGYERVLAFNLTIDKDEEREAENQELGIVNLYYEDHSKLPDLLFDICKKATNK